MLNSGQLIASQIREFLILDTRNNSEAKGWMIYFLRAILCWVCAEHTMHAQPINDSWKVSFLTETGLLMKNWRMPFSSKLEKLRVHILFFWTVNTYGNHFPRSNENRFNEKKCYPVIQSKFQKVISCCCSKVNPERKVLTTLSSFSNENADVPDGSSMSRLMEPFCLTQRIWMPLF